MRQSKLLLILIVLFIQTIIAEPLVAAVQYSCQSTVDKVALPVAERVKKNPILTKKQKRKAKRAARKKRHFKSRLKQKSIHQSTSGNSKENKQALTFLIVGVSAILLAVLMFYLLGASLGVAALSVLFFVVGILAVIAAIVFLIMALVYFIVGSTSGE